MSLNKPSKPLRRGWTHVDTDVILRAIAISMVVWNHATKGPDGVFGGGMTFLMMLSGFNFARFTLQGGTPVTVRAALAGLAMRIGVPSLLLLLFIFAVLGRFDLKEALFISNWWTRDRIAIFPIWYPEVMLQMLAALWLFFLSPFAHRALAHPLVFALGTFALGVALRVMVPRYVWDTAYLNDSLPYLFLWNFSLGWVVFLLVADPTPGRGGSESWKTALAIACIILGSAAGWGWHRLDFWWLIISGALFAIWRVLTVPRPIARVLIVVSQAAFVIFLLHRPSFSLLEHVLPAYKEGGAFVHFLFGMAFSVGIWVFLTATVRAYRQVRHEHMPHRPASVVAFPV